jgi:hypothetical protein
MVDGIIRLLLRDSAAAALECESLSETDALRIICKFDDLLEPFLVSNNYSSDKLRQAIKEDFTDEELCRLLNRCIAILEECNLANDRTRIGRYVRFLSLIVDAKFIGWYVKCGTIGIPIAKLTAIINRYRRSLFNDQQLRTKSEGSQIENLLKKRADPQTNGKIFYHQLRC